MYLLIYQSTHCLKDSRWKGDVQATLLSEQVIYRVSEQKGHRIDSHVFSVCVIYRQLLQCTNNLSQLKFCDIRVLVWG